ncbi:hypothetical protein ACWCL1_08340 [Ligilactobacillus sp. LYQ135]
MIAIPWTFIIFGFFWLLITVTITQIGYNIWQNNVGWKRLAPLLTTTLIDIIWTLLVLSIYKVINTKMPYVFNIINTFLNYVWKFIPKGIIGYILIPIVIAYVFLTLSGLYHYYKKRHEYKVLEAKKLEEEAKVTPNLSADSRQKLNDLANDHQAKTALIFRKLIRKAERDHNNLFVIKQNNDLWIPIFNNTQLSKLKEYINTDDMALEEAASPSIVKISQHNIQSFTLDKGQDVFKKSLMEGEN